MANFYWQIGVDLGSSNIRIYLKDKGIVVDDASMVARLKKKKNGQRKILVYGQGAKEMINREPKQIEVVSPIRNGIIADLEALESLMSYYFKLVYEVPSKYPKILKPRVVVGVPSFINQVQKRAIKSVLISSGAREVILVEEVILAVVGLGLPLDASSGLVIVDVGGGKTEVSVVSGGGVVIGKGIKTAGDELDNSIINYVKMKYGLLIGQNSAEKAKIGLNNNGVIRGRSLETGLPGEVKLSKSEVLEAVSMELSKIVKLVKEVLDETPPELMEDVVKRGIILVGNGAKMASLKEMIEAETKICTVLSDDPGMAVVKGCGKLVEDKKLLGEVKLVSLG